LYVLYALSVYGAIIYLNFSTDIQIDALLAYLQEKFDIFSKTLKAYYQNVTLKAKVPRDKRPLLEQKKSSIHNKR